MELYKTISIDKNMYNRKGKSFSQVLEELDPSENYKNTPLEKLDAFGRQLKRFDIKVSGADSDRVEKFFQTSSSAVLFPEYVSRAIKVGMEYADVLPDITATFTKIDGMDYRSIVSDPESDMKELKVVSEGAMLPSTVIKTQENLVKLLKRGRMLVSSYEALRFQRLDLFTVTLKQIGAYIARTQLADAVEVLVNGDGNDNPAITIEVAETGVITYNDLLKLWTTLSPYELNTLLVPTAMMEKILAMPEMQDSQATLDFHGTGRMITPMGAKLIHVPTLSSDKIIGLDKTCALELVQSGDVMVDYDKLIDRQLERATISVISGFAKVFNDACVVLKV
ncbi:MAG: phage major capsid protein [Clostridia bacterium]|nr:phage major capsid protein [Clostridia bacterium]MEE1124501.1 phage major capsid protein [Acutalibacteraceae bacterium]